MLHTSTLTLKQKCELIAQFESSKQTQLEFAKKNNIARTTLCGILKKKDELTSALTSSAPPSRKRQRNSQYEEIDEALLTWLKHARSSNIHISGVILQEKAKEIAKRFDTPSKFTASNGWIERFKTRHGLKFKKDIVNTHAIDTWKDTVLADILNTYKQCDIYNLDETGLFYKLLPHQTMSFKNETCQEGKNPELRLTLLLGVNMDGTHKLKPVVIVKSKQPRCFKNVKSLPVFYEANEKSWMTSTLWEKTVRRYDSQFHREKRSVAFIVDNCPAHTEINGLLSIKIYYLPPNATASVQPLDQGIIQDFKCHYRKQLLKCLIQDFDDGKVFEMSLLDAVYHVSSAWNDVTGQTIQNCFQSAGFSTLQHETSHNAVTKTVEGDDQDITLAELITQFQQRDVTSGNLQTVYPANICEEYCNVDNDLEICSSVDIECIVWDIKNRDINCEDGEECDPLRKITKKDAIAAVQLLKNYLPSIENCDDEVFSALCCVEKKILHVPVKKITQKRH